MSDFNDYQGGNPENDKDSSNNYSYYTNDSHTQQRDSYDPYTGEPVKKKKKSGFGKKVTKAICLGLVFGLAAGGAFWGVMRITNRNAERDALAPKMNVNIVKTSSVDAPMMEAKDVSDIVDAAMPAIVAVNTKITTQSNFFGQIYSQESSGAGSGIIMSESNGTLYVLTNYHVIEDSTSIQITFNDASMADATVKGYDKSADIAVITVDYNSLSDETKSHIAVAVMGDSSQMKPGNGAIAIGNALGYGQSVTTGAISAVDREVPLADETVALIQTSAAINPGNSGGALLNAKGEVIGVNTIKYAETQVEGMGFAIPINSALETAQAIIEGKIVPKTDENTAYLGIVGGNLREEEVGQYGYPEGIYVSQTMPYSAAERGGLKQGDIITGFNGESIKTMEELQERLKNCLPGDQITLTVQRRNQDGSFKEAEISTILGSKADIQY